MFGKWAILGASLTFVFGATHSLHGQDLSPSQLRGIDENKPVAVLQKRFFVKALRPEIGILVGSTLNEAYTDTTIMGARAGLFFSEWLGMEFQYIDTTVKASDDRRALEKLQFIDPEDPNKERFVSPQPEVNRLHGAMDLSLVIAPFYGKANFFDWFIVYTDMYVNIGAGQVETDQGDLTAMVMSLGQRFYFTQSFSMRVDFRNRIYTEERGDKKSTKNALAFDIGASFFFF